VEDWDEVPSDSLGAYCLARPSGNVLTQLNTAFLPALIILFVLVCVAYILTARRIISTLKTEYHELWVSLGRPEAIDSLMSFRGGVFPERPLSGLRLNYWLSETCQTELRNAGLTLLAKRLKMLRVMSAILIALIVGGYAIQRRG
jgi:hypothetical protein